MGTFVMRRLLQAVPTFFGITLLVFCLMQLAPGDLATLLVGQAADVAGEDVEALRRAYGVDRPIALQYLSWLGRVLTGDFGQSFLYKRPVGQMILATLPNTLQLSLLALLISLTVGVSLGLVAARYRGSALDQAIRVFSVAGHAIPAFWFALLFILVFSVELRVFPVGGMLTVGASPWDLGDRARHLVGPVLALSLAGIANYARYMRTEMLEVLGQDFIRTARAKGLRERTVLSTHGLRNALLPIVTALGGLLANLVSGALVVEQVFGWPGMGRLTFEAARSKDYPIVMAVVVITSALLLLGYLLRDLAYGLVDPRVGRDAG